MHNLKLLTSISNMIIYMFAYYICNYSVYDTFL